MTTTYASVITMHASSLRRGSHRRISRYHVARLPLHLIHLAIATNGPSAIKNANHPHSDEADEPSERLPPRSLVSQLCHMESQKSREPCASHKPRKTTQNHAPSRRPAPREHSITQTSATRTRYHASHAATASSHAITQATPQPRHRTPSQRITHDACDAPAARCRRSGQPQRQQVPLRPQRP